MSKLNEAVAFASLMHEGQVRKVTGLPYILHPLEVLTIVAKLLPNDEDAMCAAVLHDTVEDTPVTLKQIETRFGTRVSHILAGDNEDAHAGLSRTESWKMRKEESLAMLKSSEDIAIRAIWMGDKLSNMRSMYGSWKLRGDSIFVHFHAGKADQKWYYSSIAELLARDFKRTDEYAEYTDLVNRIFGDIQ